MESYLRRGIEREYWALRKSEQGYTALDVRASEEFGRVLAECGGTWEYQWNVFELKTLTKEEETDPKVAEFHLVTRLEKLLAAARNLDENAVVICCGTYPGRDDPSIDTSESSENTGDNAFWGEFNLACPADAFTRYTTADQLCISVNNGNQADIIRLYNRLVGLSPFLVYCFSTSPCVQGIPLDVWSRRQQLIDAKGLQSGQIFPGTYPLRSTEQYQRALEKTGKEIEKQLSHINPYFFCRDGNSPRETIAEYRGSDWGFYKLFTQQVVRFHQKKEIPGYLEIRCIDAQECTKIAAALSHMGELVATAGADLDKNLPRTEDELRQNLRAATYRGEKGTVTVNGKSMPLPQYAGRIGEILFSDKDDYSCLLRERVLNPPALEIRKRLKQKQNVVEILSMCLQKNKTILEI